MKKNKISYSLLIIFSALFFTACSQQPAPMIIKGKLDNPKNTKIILGRLTQTSIEPIDSTNLNDKGEFTFSKIINKNPEYYLLRVGNKGYLYLILDSAVQIDLKGNADNIMETYTVTGSKDCEILQKASQHNLKNLMRVDSISKIYQANIKNPKLDSVKASLDIVYKEIFDDEQTFVKKMIKENTSSLASYMLLYQQLGNQNFLLNPQEDMAIYEKVDDALYSKYPNNAYAQSLHTYLIQLKEQLKAQAQAQKNTAIGTEAPDFEVPTPDGKTIKLSDLRGQYVLLDFWASWCRPCRGENPNVVAAYKKYHSKGFEILQVSLDKSKEAWENAIKKDGLGAWKHGSDLQYWQSAPARLYNVQSIPANFLIDKEGKIIATNLRGPALGAKLSEVLD